MNEGLLEAYSGSVVRLCACTLGKNDHFVDAVC